MYKLMIAFFAFSCTLISAQKIPVQIYYESLCEDSQAFITQQLYPVLMHGFKDFVEITWIPFGKSKYETRGSDILFECHHGQNECYGNKVHACAIAKIEVNSYQMENTKESKTLEYINCLMKAGKNFADNIYPGEKCAREVQLTNWPSIAECANSTEGNQLLKKYGDITMQLNPPLKSVPYITFKDEKNLDNQKLVLTDFGRALCSAMQSPQPRICSIYNAAGHVMHNLLATLFVAFSLTAISVKIFA